MANSESSQRPDLQDLVAYLQGRGDEVLRAQVLKRLDEDEEYLELMVDLVPMLRAAGEIADPDAEQEEGDPSPPAAPPLAFVAPAPSVKPLPLPANAPATAARFHRWPMVAALAALVPIAVTVWLVAPWKSRFFPQQLAEQRPIVRMPDLSRDPLESEVYRGTDETEIDPEDAKNLFMTGARLMDLQLRLSQGDDVEAAKDALKAFENSLAEEYRLEFLSVHEALDRADPSWPKAQKALAEGYQMAFTDKNSNRYIDQGACVRAGWLAVKARNPDFLTTARGCRDLVGADKWTSDEQLLAQMLQEERVQVEPPVARRGR